MTAVRRGWGYFVESGVRLSAADPGSEEILANLEDFLEYLPKIRGRAPTAPPPPLESATGVYANAHVACLQASQW